MQQNFVVQLQQSSQKVFFKNAQKNVLLSLKTPKFNKHQCHQRLGLPPAVSTQNLLIKFPTPRKSPLFACAIPPFLSMLHFILKSRLQIKNTQNTVNSGPPNKTSFRPRLTIYWASSITARTCPRATRADFCAKTFTTVPPLEVATGVSIFMASRTQSWSPAATVAPASQVTSHTLAGKGAVTFSYLSSSS